MNAGVLTDMSDCIIEGATEELIDRAGRHLMMVQRFVKITAVDTRNEVTHDESHPGPGQRD